MADTRAGSSVQAAVAFGQKLADLLQTIVELNLSDAVQTSLKSVLHDVLITSGTLRQLQDLMVDEAVGPGQIARPAVTSACLNDVEKLAVKCDLIYKTVMLISQKAVARDKSKGDDSELPSLEDLKNELLIGPIPDPSSVKSIRLVGTSGFGDQREWVENRLDRCQEQLQWIGMGLLVHLHIFKLVKQQLGTVERDAGAFEQELISRGAVQILRTRQTKFAKRKARKQEKAQRQWELRRDADDSDTESVVSDATSARSSTTASTAVDNSASAAGEAPMGKDISDVEDLDKGNDKVDANATDEVTGLDKSIIKDKTPRSVASKGKFSLDLPAFFFEWKQKLFGTDDKFKTDWPSTKLEAYIRHTRNHWKPNKIPFGHKRLTYGLNKVIKDGPKGTSTWSRYIELDQHTRLAVDDIVKEANQHQSRERVCVALQQYNQESDDPFILVFLTVRKEPKPISFKDAVGRTYALPFETCRTWEAMKCHMTEAFNHVKVIGPHVMEGHFDLITSDGHIILPHLWATTVKPGAAIDMRMWPVTTSLRGFYGEPPFVVPNSESQARHLARMRQVQQQRMNAMRTPPHAIPMRPPMGMPMGMPHGGHPPPMHRPPPPPGMPVFVDIVDGGRPMKRTAEAYSKDDITEKEDEQMMFVDFVEELEKTKTTTVADLLTRFTNLKDVPDDDCLANLLNTDSDYDSDDSGTSSSSSELIDD
ncbi:hypothetical protein Daus18300_001103 [Diaporthe australafricana]|uniref:Ubiquitin-like domain-containing protein n=1 Tax=Diaporthe australafricana TaxID=127596 RepID=A0ABR3XZ10_9PEZI